MKKLLVIFLFCTAICSAQILPPIIHAKPPASSGTATCGFTTVGGTDDSGNSGLAICAPCTPAQDSTVTDAKISIGASGSGSLTMGVFDSDGSGGSAHTKLCSTSTYATGSYTVNSLNTLAISGCGTLTSGHNYWVCTGSTSFVSYMTTGTGSDQRFGSFTCCTWPSAITATSTTGGFNMYIDLSF